MTDKTTINEKRQWVRLTRMCNNRCIFCLDADAQNGSVISYREILANLQSGAHYNCSRAVLSGGEPTLHPKFFSVIKYARSIGYSGVQVVTNGRLFSYKGFLEKAINSGVTELTFTIQGHTPRLHDYQTAIKGSFIQSIKGLLNALSQQGLVVNIDIVVNKCNIRFLRRIIQYFIDLGVEEFDLLQVIPFGRAWVNKKKVLYEPFKEINYLRDALQLKRENKINIWTNRLKPVYLEGFEDMIQPPEKLFDEIQGRQEAFKEFLVKGEKLFCYSQRCRFCFLESFCRDLMELKQEKILQAKPLPPCLRGKVKNANNGSNFLRFSEIIKNYPSGLKTLVQFYIDNRYFVKGENCCFCKHNDYCQGAPIKFIRDRGFSSLEIIND